MRCTVALVVVVAALIAGVAASAQRGGEVVRDAGGKPIEGDARLLFAARHGRADVVRALLASGVPPAARDPESGATALHHAAGVGALAVVRELLYDGTALAPGAAALLELADVHGARPLHYAAANARRDAVRALLAAGASPLARTRAGATPLYDAARHGALGALELLARAAPSTVEQRAGDGTTPLYVAAAAGEEACAEALLEAGADVHARMDGGTGGAAAAAGTGETALHAAARTNNVALVALLLEYGADVRAQTAHGAFTPLHAAVAADQQRVYGALLHSEHGSAAALVKDANGDTPRALLERLGATLLH